MNTFEGDAVIERAEALREGKLHVELIRAASRSRSRPEEAEAVHARRRIEQHVLRGAGQPVKRRIRRPGGRPDQRSGLNVSLVLLPAAVSKTNSLPFWPGTTPPGAERPAPRRPPPWEELLDVRRQEPLLEVPSSRLLIAR